MQQAPLGNTGITVSRLGLGTVKLGRDRAVKYPAPFAIPDDAAAAKLLDRAEELGVTLLDTAPAYGASEERLGRLLEGRSHPWVLCTKVGEEFDGHASTFDFTTAAVRRSVDRSLERLRRDVLDIALIHSDGRDEHCLGESGALLELRELQRRGKVRAVGASTKTPLGALLAVELCDVVMLTLNAGNDGDLPAFRTAAERGVGVLVKKALESGHAASPEAVEGAFKVIFAQTSPASVVVGTINPDHLSANAAALERALAATASASSTSANRR